MTPVELYTILSDKYPYWLVDSVCCVETTCKRNGYCAEKQNREVLDFDEIKKQYYNGQNIQMPASVDAICLGNKKDHFIFVEMKGWENYISHLTQQKKTVEETASSYNLDRKLLDSQELCRKIAGDNDLFANIPTIFLLVTDIDIRTHGMESFTDMMFTLAGTGSDIYSQCLTVSRRTLDSSIHIDHDFVFCRDFDNYVSRL